MGKNKNNENENKKMTNEELEAMQKEVLNGVLDKETDDETEEYKQEHEEEQEQEYEQEELSEIETLQKQNEELQEEIKEEKNEYLRGYAELDNMKKRLEREKYQAIDYASEQFAIDLLTPIDALRMAIDSAQNSNDVNTKKLLENLEEGIALTIKNFNTVFEKHDINEVEYQTFDPQFHNAIAQEANEQFDDGDIIEVLQKGYVLKDRLLRPAMVRICKH